MEKSSGKTSVEIPIETLQRICQGLRDGQISGPDGAQLLEREAGLVPVARSESFRAMVESTRSANDKDETPDGADALQECLKRMPQVLREVVEGVISDPTQSETYETVKVLDDACKKKGADLMSTSLALCPPGQAPGQQDVIYTGAGLDRLREDARKKKQLFDEVSRKLTSSLEDLLGIPCAFLSADVKSRKRSAEKVDIEYLGDASKLKDAVRGTVVIKGCSKDVMKTMYKFLGWIISADPPANSDDLRVFQNVRRAMTETGAVVISFKDRYARPLGDYRDWNMVLQIQGFSGELQINFAAAIAKKELAQHGDYEVDRVKSADLLHSCMLSQWDKATNVLLDGAKTSSKDANDLTALHYAAAFNAPTVVELLLERRADPLATDNQGKMPLHRSVLNSCGDVTERLVRAMQLQGVRLSALPESGKGGLMKTWMVGVQGEDSNSRLLHELLSAAEPSLDDQMHHAARIGDVLACRAIKEKGGRINWWLFRVDVGSPVFPLDQAVLEGHVGVLPEMVEMGAIFNSKGPHKSPQNAAEQYVRSDQTAQLAALLRINVLRPSHCGQEISDEDMPAAAEPWGQASGTPLELQKLLSLAVAQKRLGALKLLIGNYEQRFSQDAATEAGSALLESVASGQARLVELLIHAGAPLDHVKAEHTALHLVAVAGFRNIAKQILVAKADLQKGGPAGRTAAWLAAFAGHAHLLQDLLDARADPDAVDEFSVSLVYAAAEKGRTFALKVLLDAGADLHKANKGGYTPALVAADNGHVTALTILKDGGADLNQPDNEGSTPVWMAARNGCPKSLKFLIKEKADVNRQNEGGFSPAYVAAEHDRVEALKLLIEGEADVNIQNRGGCSPVYAAAERDRVEALKLLINVKANVNLQNEGGFSPVYVAAENDRVEALKLLIEGKADVNLQNRGGFSPAYVAAERDRLEALKLLIEGKADVNLQNEGGFSPAYVAAENDRADALSMLADAGADLSRPTNRGHIPSFVAAENGKARALKVLIDANADLTCCFGTAKEVAEQNGHSQVLSVLENWRD